MLEGLVAWVLNNYLGKYVSNLNTDQLSVALLKGAVELENLPLKKDALKELLPFEVRAGFIGKITLQIPFYRPHIDPWVISVSKLHLIGSPGKQEDFDEERESLLERESKKAILLALEQKWKKEREQVAESYWYSVTASVVARIVENIELNIQDVHLRFEDGITNPSQPFAFGVCIKNVSVQNAVNEPVEELMKKKQLDISDFSIYWDTDCALLGDLPPGELQEAMDRSMESREHDYIMEPVRTSALLKRNCSKEPLRSRNSPRLEFDIQLETIPLKLSQTQYRQIMDFLKELERKERQVKFRRWKPKVTVTANCREWWRFALNAHISEIREKRGRSSWEFVLHRARDAVSYTDIYYKKLREVPLSEEEQREMERIEDEQTVEELKILREVVFNRFWELAESIKEPLSDALAGMSEAEPESHSSTGMLQYLQSWFPGWGGWYGESKEALEKDTFEGLLSEAPEQWRPEDVTGADELFDPAADVSDINTFTKRDHVFAKLNLRLQGGSVTLLHAEKRALWAPGRAFMQLEFSGVTILAETLPRRNSSLFKVQLGSLFLRDLATEGTIFPVLVFPNPQKEVGCASSIGLQTSSDTSNQSSGPAVPVFEMLYEQNPVRSSFERRLEVRTQPLNIIYNPQAIKKVADFFYKGRVHTSGFGCQSALELRVAEAARRQYNKLKMQTKAEIRQTIDRLLVGEFIEDSKRWTVCLDIFAPQVIFPDDFKSADPILVVIDLGRMLLTNSQAEDKVKGSGGPSSELSDLSDDEYKTPLATPPSSPPPEASATDGDKTLAFTEVEISEEQLQAHLMSRKMYDTYSLSFMDLQIMVGRVKDNWKYAQDIDVGPTHVVEKFNVHLQLERRLIYTSDPKYPGAALSGNLPDLKIHINEDKVIALKNCFGRLSTSETEIPGTSQMGKEASSADLDQHGSLHSSVMNLTQSVMTVEQHTKEVLVESQLLLAEFQVNCMQLGVESNGRYIAVLKVFGTNAHFVKRPYDAEVSLTVHGLLLVDTMQTYGSDFDLLMASHKNLSFDVPTGSLRDSRFQPPVAEPSAARAFDGMPLSRECTAASKGISPPNDETLIKLEYQFVSAECPSMSLDSTLQVISVQMNNLDIILNPETMVELIGFLQKSFPKGKDSSSPQPLMAESERSFYEQESFQSTYAQSTEVAVDIRWLNILLLRTVTTINGDKVGRKIATASIGGTKMNVSMGSRLEMNGSLGCLHLMDLTQDSIKNPYVVSIGNPVRYEHLLCDASDSKPAFLQPDSAGSLPDALSFSFTKQSEKECSLHLRMASLHYNHSAKFLKEIALSLDELEENFRGMLKSAATKVTFVLATKTAEYTEMVSLFDTTPRSRDPLNLESGEGEELLPVYSKTETIKLILNVNIESPVVSIPRKPGSAELLVGHLGQISIQSFVAGEDNLRSDKLQVEIRDIKMYSLNSSHFAGKKDTSAEAPRPSHPPSGSQEESQFTRHDFFESVNKGHAFHILNNATIQFKLEKIPVESDAELAFSVNEDIEISSLMRIEGMFVNPLQVVLAKHVYEQVLQTLDHLVCNEDLTNPPSGVASSPYPSCSSPSASLHSTGSDFSIDRKDNGLFGHSSFSPSSSKFVPVKEAVQSFTQIRATFHISELQVQLSGDLTLGAQGLVSLKFQDFEVEFAKDHPCTLSVQIALGSLLMEDLLEKNPDSLYKNLMVSRGAPKPSSLAHKEYLSQSCPSVSNVEYPDMPRSLPSHMEEAPNVFQLYQRPTCSSHKKHKDDTDSEYPLTPPPSPTSNKPNMLSGKSNFDDSLVHINMLLVDKKHPGFSSCYDKINRSVDVDFNCLDVLVTLQTWVVILDFFGIGSTAENHSLRPSAEGAQHTLKSEPCLLPTSEAQDSVNTKVDLKVHSLSLVLNKSTNELAKANVSKLVTHVEMIEGDTALQGSIGSLSLSDLTSHGELYRERFTTRGEEALIFQVYKHGRPDPLLQRECDVRVSLRMASVQYVHTQRFQAEVVSFIQHFTQLQDVLGRQRAAIEGQMVRNQAQRAARVLLDIEAGAPVLLIPESSRSNHLIVANLGKLKVKNKFLFAGTAGTFSLKDKNSVPFSSPSGTPKHGLKKTSSANESKVALNSSNGSCVKSSSSGPSLNRMKSEPAVSSGAKTPKSPVLPAPPSPEEQVCLLDCIVVDLQDMDIFAAERYSREYSKATEDSGADLSFPSFIVRQTGASLLTEPFRLKLQVERNLDKEISHAVPDISIHGIVSSVHCSLDLSKYKLIRGLLENNLGEPIEEFLRPYDLQDPRIHTVLSGEVYTCMSFLIDMVNVSLELTDPPGKPGSLARFDFKKSKLLFESFSNQTKAINLVSHSMLAFDTRYTSQKASAGKQNVFSCIFQSSRHTGSQGAIQIELHYRSTKDSSSFTVVLNSLRVFLIFDWLVLLHHFLQTPSDTKKPSNPTPARQRNHSSEAAVVPKAVKSGIVTKRSALQIPAEKQLEVKINVTETEFVVVEDMSCLDTSAIILKGTTVLTYRPQKMDHPFSSYLSDIEVFSCRLGNEQETALSIVDPAHIQIELVGNHSYPSGSGLLDAFNSEDFPPFLEIHLQTLDIRLSYNDIQLFLAIAKSIPGQTGNVISDSNASDAGVSTSVASSGPSCVNEPPELTSETAETSKHTLDPVLELQLARLQELGFSLQDCRKALLDCQGQLKTAASWLFKNAEPLKRAPLEPSSRDSQGSMTLRFISGLDIKADSVCICFIDDCMDCDIPLAELTFSRLNFLQHLRASPEGNADFTLSGDYYNRELSGWEPFIEPWPCSVSWQKQPASRLHPSRLKVEMKARRRLDINITSVLIEQYTRTKQSWMADYCKEEKVEEVESEQWMGSSVDPLTFGQGLPLAYLRTRSTASLANLEHQMYAREMKTPKRRQPFVPFALRNHTGCTLWFATLTTTPTRAALSHSGSPGVIPEENGTFLDGAHKVSEWHEVLTGEEVPFAFEAKGKLRHSHTHKLRIHQLQVRVSGWEPVSPVSVDKVGIFFRYAAPDKSTSSSTVGSPINRTNIIHPHVYFSALPPVRVVFAVTMEGSARKVVTVRSALIVKNKLDIPMELRLDSPSAPDKPVVLPSVMPGDFFPIPLHLTSWRLQVRPKGMGVFFCKSPIHWTHVQKTSEVSSSKRECHATESENSRFFRFRVAIKKENYPDYMPSSIFSDSAKQIFRLPGHTIYLLPTMVICNLLPCEVEFCIKGTPIRGTLKPGKEALLHTADTSQNVELGVSLENFPHCKELLIPPGTQNYVVRMRLYDVKRRLLNLTIRIVCRAEGSLKIFISAPYWLINKTGLPLIFRQDNAKTDAAGQFDEHELARSLSPLLFCYADKEQPHLCTMRIGRGIHPEGTPGWCQGFSLDGGNGVRALKVIQQGNRPGLIYNIGIDVKTGRGRYIDTCIVIFAPRYLLDNKSMHKLAFAQRKFARGQGTSNPEGYISTLPGSSVVFHWPRNDCDQLLCVRLMDVPNCIWSGGFELNKISSFHINMRDTFGKCYFLRVEITLKGATFRVSFSNTDQLPPTFRIDNFSKVPVVFTQHGVTEPRLSTEVKAGTSLDYAWDEPTLGPFITLTVKGAGSSEVTCSMNNFQESKQLYYENFIYIAATYTFSGLQEDTGRPVASTKEVDCAELVLDVCLKTQRVILKKKEPGKRSQLWRMTGTGMLCHEGSAVPRHPNKSSPPWATESSMILDIAGLAAVTDNRYEPLMLRKPDRRRSTTQTWSFRDGKLVCGMHGLVVQAKGGVKGLQDGAEVVLGPDTALLGPVPPEQQFINQKMRPGSGILAVRVIPDGPTRVLQITDFNQRRNDRFSYEGDELEQDLRKLRNPDTEEELEVQLKLEGGVGLSLVNKAPEELIFASFTGIHLHFTQLSTSQMLELSVQDVQVDNQLLRTTQPFVLFVTPVTAENEIAETAPALQLNAVKFPSKSPLTDIYKHLMITASKFTVQIEEKLFFQLLSFFGYDLSESEVENYSENLHEAPVDQGGAQKRYYFENLKISLPQIKLSVFTSSSLPVELKALKSSLGFPLIRFEDAVINLDPFTRVHPYETKEFIICDILKHFQEELIGQAAKILSSVDFLGNPMGLLNDVSEGVTGLIKYGNIGGLIRNVTHGVSNSAAKFTGTLSDGLGKTMDNRHQTEREYIRYHAATSGEHLVAGIQGLTHGIIGGLTSVITSTIEGVKTEGGVSGFISGFGKGLVGTVTKPVAGALDFASETAQAVRQKATVTSPRTPERVRRPRCCAGPQGLLPRYSETQAEGQELMFKLTDSIQDEFFIAVENIESFCVIISSKAVYFLKSAEYMDREAIFLEVKYEDLYHCLISKDHGKVYVQLTKKAVNSSSGVSMPGPSHQKPMVHVTAEEPAVKLCQEINYAKSLFYEQQLMLRSSEHQEQAEMDS
ncbi:vacuolar protein sorting-associated protein 13D isoform X3 [Varanus komodoensis]|uniref:vacuolar protein sorting-associated protein 13D isoform X3 n=1 Tax=Varanus komodoensis TaxID=61221 RepID=UPI001CF7C0C0|nr:vacuolar protein sorting-associated protein 13D isoform X3 [Varanus komodoensis]